MGSVEDASVPPESLNDSNRGIGADGEDVPPASVDDASTLDVHADKLPIVDGNPPARRKVEVLLKAVAGAPVMKVKKFLFFVDQPFSDVIKFIAGKKYLKLGPSDSLFVYVNQMFAPSPDQSLENLYDCFNVEGKLVLHYCLTKAWG